MTTQKTSKASKIIIASTSFLLIAIIICAGFVIKTKNTPEIEESGVNNTNISIIHS